MRRRPKLVAALLYAAAAIAFFGPGLVPGKTLSNSDTLLFEPPWVAGKPAELRLPSNTDLGDEPELIQPFLRKAAGEMPDVPLWNPQIVGGRPFHANAQSALFSPFTLPVYLLPFWTAWGWIAVLKLWVAAFGTFLLARALGMRFGGALIAGLVFAFSLKLTTWVSYPHVGVWSLFPWLLLCTERLVRRPDLLAGSALAGVTGLLFLAGHPESSFHGLLLASSFFAPAAVAGPATGRHTAAVGPAAAVLRRRAGGGRLSRRRGAGPLRGAAAELVRPRGPARQHRSTRRCLSRTRWGCSSPTSGAAPPRRPTAHCCSSAPSM